MAEDRAPVAEEPAWTVKPQVWARLFTDLARDDDFEARHALDARALVETKRVYPSINTSLKVGVEARYEAFDARDNGKSDLALRDAYVEVRRDQYSVSFGNQAVTWGKLDDLVILDQISPQDYRWFVLYDKQARKIQTLMLNYRRDHGGGFQTDFIYIPVFQPSEVEFFGTDWSIFGHLKDAVARQSLPPAVKAMVDGIRIEDGPEYEAPSLDEGEAGLRLRSTMGAVDYGLYYMNIHNRVPALKERTAKGNLVKQFLFDPTSEHLQVLAAALPGGDDLVLEKGYERGHVVGADFETTLGSCGLRGEWGYFTDQPFMKEEGFSYVVKNTTSLGVGIDHTTEDALYWNLQLMADLVLDYEDLYGVEEFSPQAALNAHKDFLMGDLRLDLRSIYRFAYRDWMLNPQLRYTYRQNTELALGSRVFGGDFWTLFGRYDDKDLVYVEARYRF